MDVILIKGTKDMEITDLIELLVDSEILVENDVFQFPNCMLVFVKQWFDNERVYNIVNELKRSLDESVELELGEHTFRISTLCEYDDIIDCELEKVAHIHSFQEYEWLSKYKRDELDYEMDVLIKCLETFHLNC